jgi:hypothetical protein
MQLYYSVHQTDITVKIIYVSIILLQLCIIGVGQSTLDSGSHRKTWGRINVEVNHGRGHASTDCFRMTGTIPIRWSPLARMVRVLPRTPC